MWPDKTGRKKEVRLRKEAEETVKRLDVKRGKEGQGDWKQNRKRGKKKLGWSLAIVFCAQMEEMYYRHFSFSYF